MVPNKVTRVFAAQGPHIHWGRPPGPVSSSRSVAPLTMFGRGADGNHLLSMCREVADAEDEAADPSPDPANGGGGHGQPAQAVLRPRLRAGRAGTGGRLLQRPVLGR